MRYRRERDPLGALRGLVVVGVIAIAVRKMIKKYHTKEEFVPY